MILYMKMPQKQHQVCVWTPYVYVLCATIDAVDWTPKTMETYFPFNNSSCPYVRSITGDLRDKDLPKAKGIPSSGEDIW